VVVAPSTQRHGAGHGGHRGWGGRGWMHQPPRPLALHSVPVVQTCPPARRPWDRRSPYRPAPALCRQRHCHHSQVATRQARNRRSDRPLTASRLV